MSQDVGTSTGEEILDQDLLRSVEGTELSFADQQLLQLRLESCLLEAQRYKSSYEEAKRYSQALSDLLNTETRNVEQLNAKCADLQQQLSSLQEEVESKQASLETQENICEILQQEAADWKTSNQRLQEEHQLMEELLEQVQEKMDQFSKNVGKDQQQIHKLKQEIEGYKKLEEKRETEQHSFQAHFLNLQSQLDDADLKLLESQQALEENKKLLQESKSKQEQEKSVLEAERQEATMNLEFYKKQCLERDQLTQDLKDKLQKSEEQNNQLQQQLTELCSNLVSQFGKNNNQRDQENNANYLNAPQHPQQTTNYQMPQQYQQQPPQRVNQYVTQQQHEEMENMHKNNDIQNTQLQNGNQEEKQSIQQKKQLQQNEQILDTVKKVDASKRVRHSGESLLYSGTSREVGSKRLGRIVQEFNQVLETQDQLQNKVQNNQNNDGNFVLNKEDQNMPLPMDDTEDADQQLEGIIIERQLVYDTDEDFMDQGQQKEQLVNYDGDEDCIDEDKQKQCNLEVSCKQLESDTASLQNVQQKSDEHQQEQPMQRNLKKKQQKATNLRGKKNLESSPTRKSLRNRKNNTDRQWWVGSVEDTPVSTSVSPHKLGPNIPRKVSGQVPGKKQRQAVNKEPSQRQQEIRPNNKRKPEAQNQHVAKRGPKRQKKSAVAEDQKRPLGKERNQKK